MLTILLILLLLAFISGSPLFTIMLGATALGSYFSTRGFDVGFSGAIGKMFGISSRDEIEVLSTIPLFIYAGYMLAEAKTADRLVRFANAMLGWVPGGLAIVTICTCALFTVFTGASGVTIIALGGVLMPALIKNGYPERFAMGLIAGTGSVGLLFPPALPLFIYGTVYGLTGLDKENWDTERFLFAGIVPGMVLVGMLSAVAVAVAIKKKLPRQKFSMKELGTSFVVAVPELFIPFGVILGMATGFGLPEIASLTVVYVTFLEMLVYRTLTPKMMWKISYEGMAMIGAIFIIIFASTALTDFMVNAEVPKKLVAWTQNNIESKIVFLLAINLILLIVGTVMDIFSAIVVVLPLIAPIAKAYGIDPYHLGVIFLLNLEVGYIHPPVGLNLFLTSVKFNKPITEVMWATIPFLITMMVALVVITYVPALTIVPEAKRTAPVWNLVEIAQNGVEESKVSIPEITLVDAGGTPIKDVEGKPTTRKFVDCRPKAKPAAALKAGDPLPPPKEELEKQIRNCQELFFNVTECKPDAKSTDPKQVACANMAIAEWTIKQLNGDILHPERAVIVVNEVALVDADGKPLNYAAPVLDAAGMPVLEPGEPVLGDDLKPMMGPDGKPLLEKGEPKFEDKPLVTKDGKPVVKKLEACAGWKIDSERDGCRAPFVLVTNCKLNFDAASCIEEKTAECGAAPTTPIDGGAGSGSGVGSADMGSGSGSAEAAGSAVGSAAEAGSAGSAAGGSGSAQAQTGSGSAQTGSGSAQTGSGSADTGSGTPAAGSAGSAAAGSAAGSAAPVPASAAQCVREKTAACVKETVDKCVVDETASWVGDKDNLKFLFDPALPDGKQAATTVEAADSGGCSTSGGGMGVLLVGATLVVLRRRHRSYWRAKRAA